MTDLSLQGTVEAVDLGFDLLAEQGLGWHSPQLQLLAHNAVCLC